MEDLHELPDRIGNPRAILTRVNLTLNATPSTETYPPCVFELTTTASEENAPTDIYSFLQGRAQHHYRERFDQAYGQLRLHHSLDKLGTQGTFCQCARPATASCLASGPEFVLGNSAF